MLPWKILKSNFSDGLKLLFVELHYAFSSQIFYDILSYVINCNYPQIIAVKSLIMIKYLFKGY